jgi:hypothetical protein
VAGFAGVAAHVSAGARCDGVLRSGARSHNCQ